MVFKAGKLDPEGLRKVFGPGHIDQMVRSAIQLCWMMLPEAKKSATNVKKEIRGIVNRALRDFRKDQKTFSSLS